MNALTNPIAETALVESQPVLADSLLNFVALAVRDPSVDVAKLDALLRMQREIIADAARLEFNRAFVSLSAELTQIEKRGIADMGGKGRYSFAKREDLDEVIRPLLAKHGFALAFRPIPSANVTLTIEGELLHVGGHSKRAELTLQPDVGPGRNALQASGSTIAYAERYLSEMLLNLVRKDVDADGNKPRESIKLSTPQIEELRRLMRETRTLESRFLEVMQPGLKVIEEASAVEFPRLRNALMVKRDRAARADMGEAA